MLSQQLVAACSEGPVAVDDLYAMVLRAYPYRDLPRGQFDGVLDLLAGRYPSDEFAELRPRVVRRIAAGEQVEHAVELAARPGRYGPGAAPSRRGRRPRPAPRSRRRPAAARARRAGSSGSASPRSGHAHAARDDGALEQVAPEVGEDAAARKLHLVARTAHPLVPACVRAGQTGDLADEVDGTRVDAELERRGRDQARQVALPSAPPLSRCQGLA